MSNKRNFEELNKDENNEIQREIQDQINEYNNQERESTTTNRELINWENNLRITEKLNNWVREYNQFKRENPNENITIKQEVEIPTNSTENKETKRETINGLINKYYYLNNEIDEREGFNYNQFLSQRRYQTYQEYINSRPTNFKETQYLKQQQEDIIELLQANGYNHNRQLGFYSNQI
jgi:hypothetical protein